MAMNEARELLERKTNSDSKVSERQREEEIHALLNELQCLPLAISQAGAHMKRLSMTTKEYLNHLNQGDTRRDMFKLSYADQHRRPEVSNSVLETWKISTDQIRTESNISYHILHVIAYLDTRDIPQELLVAAACSYPIKSKGCEVGGCSTTQISELKILQAVARLEELSFFTLLQTYNGERQYEMHKLVQEALRYNLRIKSSIEIPDNPCVRSKETEAFYAGKALQVVYDLFPTVRGPASLAQYERYVAHALRIADWAEMSGTEVQTSYLLDDVALFFYDRGVWRSNDSLYDRVFGIRYAVLGEKHPDTIRTMSNLAIMYSNQGQHDKARGIQQEVLELRRQVLGEDHPDTIMSTVNLGAAYFSLGQYSEAEILQDKAVKLSCAVLGEKHPGTISALKDLGYTYLEQNRIDEAQKTMAKALKTAQEVLGDKDLNTIKSMALLGKIYTAQGRYKDGEEILVKALNLGREVFGWAHPDIVFPTMWLALSCDLQGRYNDAYSLYREALNMCRAEFGDSHYTVYVMDRLTIIQGELERRSSRTE